MRHGLIGLIGLLLTLGSLCASSQAQQLPNPQALPQPAASATLGGLGDSQDVGVTEPAPENVPTPAYPIDTQIRSIGKAMPWLGTSSPLKWGPLAVTNVTLDHVIDSFYPVGGLPSSTLRLDVLHSAITLGKIFKKQEIVLELDPQAALLDGRFRGNAGWNNHLAFGSAFQITPRLKLTLKNTFSQLDSRQLFPTDYLGLDQEAGNVIQNSFLQVAGSYLSDGVTAAMSYDITPRLNLTIAPSYYYAHTTSDQIVYVAIGHTIENETALTYRLTPRQNLGVLYTTEVLRATNVPLAANTYFNIPYVFYSNQLARTVWIKAMAGIDMAHYPEGVPSEQIIAGGLTLMKAFSRSNLAITYARGQTQENFINARSGNRADIGYSVPLFNRIAWNSGVGYYTDVGAPPLNKGGYASSKLDFRIWKMFTLSGSYSYTVQRSTTPQLLSGDIRTIVFGISWLPPILGVH
jgi:hypothetical protein